MWWIIERQKKLIRETSYPSFDIVKIQVIFKICQLLFSNSLQRTKIQLTLWFYLARKISLCRYRRYSFFSKRCEEKQKLSLKLHEYFSWNVMKIMLCQSGWWKRGKSDREEECICKGLRVSIEVRKRECLNSKEEEMAPSMFLFDPYL